MLSLSFGIGGPIVTVAMLSLALNLTLTGAFIYLAKRLIRDTPQAGATAAAAPTPKGLAGVAQTA